MRISARMLISAVPCLAAWLTSCSSESMPTGPELLPGQFCDVSPAWSPNGEWVAFFRGGRDGMDDSTWGLFKVRADGSEETRILNWPDAHGVLTIDWSEQDWLLISTADWGVYKVRPYGRTVKTWLYTGRSLGASWSPDYGRAVVGGWAALWIVDSAGSFAALLDPADSIYRSECLGPGWGSNGKILHLRYIGHRNDPVIAQVDPTSLKVDVLDSGYVGQGRGYPKWGIGKAFLFDRREANKHPQLWRVDSVGAPQRCLTCEDVLKEGAGEFDVHPLTGQIVYATLRTGGLFVMEYDGSNKRQLTWPEGKTP